MTQQLDMEQLAQTIEPVDTSVVEPALLPEKSSQERLTQRYQAWLSAQAKHTAADRYHEISEYAARAQKAVVVGEKRVQTFAPFRYKYSALQTITNKQRWIFIALGLVWLGSLLWSWKLTLATTMSLITVGYLAHLVTDVVLALAALRTPVEENIDEGIIAALGEAEWPAYTILCPLYREAQVVPQFVQAMKALDYPADKLQILFLTEEDDAETRAAIRALHLPTHFSIVTVPDGSPRTKPRACNYGLTLATGQYVVIYDAEDVPDPLQLKKAVLTFANHDARLACVQAKLNFYNPNQNIFTRWFTAEYSLWFDLILPGLQLGRLAIPLGGTSNHFPTQTLRALGGWDAFNVTEDCDLGLRLSWFRMTTVVLNSTTYEEANPRLKNWIRQRSRWIKGYMQTYLVHMREPLHYLRAGRLREFVSLQVVIGGKTAVLLINPIMWLLLLVSVLFGSHMTQFYTVLFPRPVLMVSTLCLLLGNFFYGYTYLLGCMRRQHFHLVKWMLVIPLYWAMASAAAYMALYQLFTKPHYWEKTEHGLHLQAIPVAVDTTWEEIAQVAEDLSPLATTELQHGIGPDAQPLYAYTSLNEVPVVSVQDTIAEMIVERKPALLPSEQAALLHASQHVARKDNWFIAFVLCVCLAAVGVYLSELQQHLVLLTPLALTQLKSAQHVFSNSVLLDLTQLDNNQLPVPQLALLPFVWQHAWWQNGLAVQLPALLGYIITAITCFLIARRLTKNSCASFFGALLFVASPFVFPVQGLLTGDALAIATIAMTSYAFLTWAESGRLKDVLLTACCISLMTLTCYEGWLLFPVLVLLLFVVSTIKRQTHAQREGTTIIFALLAGIGMMLWLFWNATITGNVFSFIPSAWLQIQGPTMFTHVMGELAIGIAVCAALLLKRGYTLVKGGQRSNAM